MTNKRCEGEILSDTTFQEVPYQYKNRYHSFTKMIPIHWIYSVIDHDIMILADPILFLLYET